MKDHIWDSVGALSGIAFAVLLSVGMGMSFGAGESPGPRDPSAEIARLFVEQSDRVGTASYITLAGLAFFFGFLGYFRRRLQEAEGEGAVVCRGDGSAVGGFGFVHDFRWRRTAVVGGGEAHARSDGVAQTRAVGGKFEVTEAEGLATHDIVRAGV